MFKNKNLKIIYLIYLFFSEHFFFSSLQFSAAPLAPPGGPHFENHWLGTKTDNY